MRVTPLLLTLAGAVLIGANATPPPTPNAPAREKQTVKTPADDTAFSVGGADIRLPAGTKSGEAQIIVKLTGTAAEKDCELAVEPVGTTDAVQIDLERTPRESARLGRSRSWLVAVRIATMPVLAGSAQRRFIARYCDASDILTYSINNSFPSDFSWSAGGPKPQRWNGSSPLPITLFVGASPATGVSVLPQPLITSDLSALPQPLQLCSKAIGNCDGKSVELSANRTHSLWLRMPDGSGLPRPGTYAGSIQLVSDQDPKGLPIDLKLHVSDGFRQFTGAVLILLGVLTSFFVVRYLRQRADYLSLRRPLTLLQEEVAALRKEAEKLERGGQQKPFIDAVDDLADELRNKGSLLPKGWEFWPMPDGARNPLDDYQAFLEASSSRLATLSTLFWRGWHPALMEWREGSSPDVLHVVEQALEQLDVLTDQKQLTAENAGGEAKKIVTAMNGALAPLFAKDGQSFDPAPKPEMSAQQLQFQLMIVNAAAWFIFAVLSWLVGVYLLILDRPDFGSPKDLLICFLWGFGLPSAGEGLARLTPAAIGQSMGMNVLRGQG